MSTNTQKNAPVSAEPVAHAMEATMGYRLELKPGEYCYYTPEGYALEAYKGDAPAHALYANPQPGCPSEIEVYKGWCWVRPKYNSGNIVDETFRPLFLGPQLGAPVAAQPDVTQQTLDDVMAGIPARDAEIEALCKEIETLRACAVPAETLRICGVIADKIEDGSLFMAGIYRNKDLAGFIRQVLSSVSIANSSYSLNLDSAGIRALTADAISGALALGYQGVNPPPDSDHWLAPFWEIGRESAAQAQQPVSGADGLPVEITETERKTIGALIDLAGKAYYVAEDSEDDGSDANRVDRLSMLALNDALDALEELPDDQPGFVMGPSSKAEWALRRLIPGSDQPQPSGNSGELPDLTIQWHDTPEAVHRLFWEKAAIENGLTYEELIEGAMVGETEGRQKIDLTYEQEIQAIRDQKCWGCADTETNQIHAWAAPDVDRTLLIHMLAHEIGHLTGEPHPDDIQEELRAETFGKVAATAYQMLQAQQEADKVDAALAGMVHALFRSGNSIPVTRITIDRKQYEAAIDAARKEQA